MGTVTKVAVLDKKRIEKAVENNAPCKETVIASLQEVINELETGREFANKALVILLDDQGSSQQIQVYLAGINPFESIALVSLAKDDFVNMIQGDLYLE